MRFFRPRARRRGTPNPARGGRDAPQRHDTPPDAEAAGGGERRAPRAGGASAGQGRGGERARQRRGGAPRPPQGAQARIARAASRAEGAGGAPRASDGRARPAPRERRKERPTARRARARQGGKPRRGRGADGEPRGAKPMSGAGRSGRSARASAPRGGQCASIPIECRARRKPSAGTTSRRTPARRLTPPSGRRRATAPKTVRFIGQALQQRRLTSDAVRGMVIPSSYRKELQA